MLQGEDKPKLQLALYLCEPLFLQILLDKPPPRDYIASTLVVLEN